MRREIGGTSLLTYRTAKRPAHSLTSQKDEERQTFIIRRMPMVMAENGRPGTETITSL